MLWPIPCDCSVQRTDVACTVTVLVHLTASRDEHSFFTLKEVHKIVVTVNLQT